MKAKIATIGRHRFEIDGKGIRTLVVFSGCSLTCKYCINPYTWQSHSNSTEYSVNDLIDKISIDSIYFEATQGGVTFGGGEPLLQAEFIAEFIDNAPKAWNYIVETSLAVPFEKVERIANKISLFIVDIKTLDEQAYKAYTGSTLDLARNNLLKLKELVGSNKIIVRVPIIPGYAEEESQIQTIKKIKEMAFDNIDAFRYRLGKK